MLHSMLREIWKKLTGVKLNENDIMIECSINVQNPPQEDILQLNIQN